MSVVAVFEVALLFAGAFFFLAGTVGILRFPDVFTRLHAVTKADNVGLGLVTIALMLEAETVAGVIDLGIIWLLVVLWSSAAAQLVGRHALDRGVVPWRSSR